MRLWLPRSLIIASLGLHVITLASYSRQPDMMAAFTVYPIWMWSILGLVLSGIAFLFWRAQLSLMLACLWILTVILASDESNVLFTSSHGVPEPGQPKPFYSEPTIRICTLNWGVNKMKPAELAKQAQLIADYHPHILFLQEITPGHADMIAKKVYPLERYPNAYDIRTEKGAATITPWEIINTHPNLPHSQHTTLKLPGGQTIDCVNLQLRSAVTDMRLWQPSCWINHAQNRKKQRQQVLLCLEYLKTQRAEHPASSRPVVIAGDFNAPASDPLHTDTMQGHKNNGHDFDFYDSFFQVGSGWANTWHRRMPFQRIDYIYTTRRLKAVRSSNVVIPGSDHLMVVSDFVLLKP